MSAGAVQAAIPAYLHIALPLLPTTTVLHHGDAWALRYVIAVIGPALLSGYPSIVAFGVPNLLGLGARNGGHAAPPQAARPTTASQASRFPGCATIRQHRTAGT